MLNKILAYILAIILCLFTASNAFALSFCVVNPLTSYPVLPSTNWNALNCGHSITVSAARNEFEPSSVVLKSDIALKAIRVIATDLIGKTSIIPSESVDVKYVKPWLQSGTAMTGIRQSTPIKKLTPELLLNDDDLIKVDTETNYLLINNANGKDYINISDIKRKTGILQLPAIDFDIKDSPYLLPFNIPTDVNKQIWLTFHIPKDAPAGEYLGELKIKSGSGTEITSVPIFVNVRPYELVEPLLEYSIYYRGFLTSNNRATISSEAKSENQMRIELKNMLDHGVTNPTIYQDHKFTNEIEKILDLRTELGYTRKDIYYLGITTGNYEDKNDLLIRYEAFDNIKQLAQSKGFKDVFVYGIDESEPNHIKGQYPAWDKIHQLGGKIFAAAWRNDRERLLAGKVDLLVNGITPNRDVNQNFSRAGTKVYLYNRPQIGVEDPNVYRASYGIGAWQKGFNGVMNYAYQHSFGNIWNDFDHEKFRDHVFAYPTSNGVIDTIAWEGFREAVDDVRYLSTLVSRISRTGIARCNASTHCANATVFVEGLKDKKISNFDKLRRDIDFHIQKLL